MGRESPKVDQMIEMMHGGKGGVKDSNEGEVFVDDLCGGK